jgi:hypothetical protein
MTPICFFFERTGGVETPTTPICQIDTSVFMQISVFKQLAVWFSSGQATTPIALQLLVLRFIQPQ